MRTLLTTDGLVLHTTHYSESSVIARIFTRELGVRSFMVKGVRGRGGRTKQNQLQPLSHIELTAYNNPRAEINYIKEINLLHDSGGTMVENALRFFKAELLYKTLRNEDPQPELFAYVTETSPHPAAHQPILFMLRLSRYLGIEPLDNYSAGTPCFDLAEGRFAALPMQAADSQTAGAPAFDTANSVLLHQYLQSLHNQQPLPGANQRQRTELIDLLLAYYSTHLNEFRHFTSHEILHTVLN